MAKRALVAGGTGRVGRAIAQRLEADGWTVLAAGRADGDLSSAAGARMLVDHAERMLGGLDLVVHAAGNGFKPRAVAEVTEADWDAALGVTVKGTFFLAQAAAPALHAANGVFVIIEDVAAYEAWPSYAAHSAAKAAQASLTRTLARALAPDVRVCGVAPGTVAVGPEEAERQARRTLVGRIGKPEDVADAVAYLAGADFVTGTSLVVDGGRLAQSTRPPRP
jgi:NAD(P)-dependent dehydrogenase (short-subunit alcohol dehydrogenase family)